MCLCCHERGQNSFRFPSMKSRRTETDVHKRCDHTVSFQVSFRVGKRRDYPPKTFTKISSIIWLMTPQIKKNWVFFFVFAPEAQRLFPWAPVHCFYPTNCTAVMKHANQRFKMLYVWGKAKPLGHCFNLTMQKHTGPWLFDLINIKDHICTPWSKRSLLPAASLTPSGCVISWATAFSPPPSGT